MVLMTGQFREALRHDRLREEARAQGLSYLAYLRIPKRGLEGSMAEVGEPCASRQVEVLRGTAGRAELHWPADAPYAPEQARALLAEMEEDGGASVSQRLHNTICQSLTAAHLHLELGLMTRPEAGEEFGLARQLVHEATVSVRELIDELAGEGE